MIKKKKIILFVIFLVTIIAGLIFFVIYNKKNIKVELIKKEETLEIKSNQKVNPETLSWEQITSSAEWSQRDSHGFVVYKNKIWVIGGVDGTTRMISPGNVDYGNAPHFSDVWSSEDGINWQKTLSNAPWGERRSATVAEFKDKMWLMGGWGPEIGCKNDIWSSEDGINWKLKESFASWPQREGHQVLIFQDKLWIIGGVNY